VTSRASAKRYARALFDVASAEGHDLEQIGAELSGIAALVAAHDQLERVLASPAIPAARKRAVMEQLFARRPVSIPVTRLLLLLADRDRLMLLPDLAEAYQDRLLDYRQVVRAEIRTAVPVSGDRAAALQAGLAQATGRAVQLDLRVDPALVGGAVARIGSTVYDGSIVTQLEKLKALLVSAEV
jgi:F-type H+-transporting ATPase subunit delta